LAPPRRPSAPSMTNAQPSCASPTPDARSRISPILLDMRCVPLSKPHAAYIINWSNVNDTISLAVIMDATWFQQAIERAGASQADLARHLRLAPSAVSRMLKGERQMKLLEAVQISSFLGVSQDDVLRHAGATGEAVSRPMPGRRGRPPRAASALGG